MRKGFAVALAVTVTLGLGASLDRYLSQQTAHWCEQVYGDPVYGRFGQVTGCVVWRGGMGRD